MLKFQKLVLQDKFLFSIDGQLYEGIFEDDTSQIKVISSIYENIQPLFEIFKKVFFFNINGIMNNKVKFCILNCIVSSQNIDINTKTYVYKINIGSLYIGDVDIDKTTKNIKKSELNISHKMPFLKKTKLINIPKYDCTIQFDEKIIITFSESNSLDKLNQIIFELKIFLNILVLNRDIEIIEKYLYLEDEKKVEEIIKHEQIIESKTSYLIKEYNNFDIEKSLNLWFDAKERYGKIFGYLSGILKESTFNHIEFKLFALSQWIEAYSREFLQNEIKNTKLDINKQKFLERVSGKDNSLRTNLNALFIIKNLEELLFNKENRNKKNTLIHDIVCYRNNLTHLNVEDNLNHEQAINLYEILKSLILIFIMDELQIKDNEQYENLKKEIKYSYNKYDDLSRVLKKCKNK